MYHVSCCETWDWQSEHYDVVIVICANFATPAMRAALFDNCMNTLKPDGILILKGYSIQELAALMRENLTSEQLGALMQDGFTLEDLTPATRLNGVAIGEHYYSEELLHEAFSSLQILEILNYEEPSRRKDGSVRMQALMGMVARKKAS
jgi:hypothetical protein